MAQAQWDVRLDVAAATRIAMTGATGLVQDTTRQVFNRANILAPVDTGRLRASHRMSVRTQDLRVRGEVTADVKYAMAVHNGTGPRVIRPRRKKALAFTVGGRRVVVASVRHPGTRGNPWLANALEEVALTGDTWRVSTARMRAIAERMAGLGLDDY